MSIRKYILSICLISLQSVFAQEYFIYVTAESEDEVAVVKFDAEAQQAETVQRIPVGYMPTEIEGPHGITVSPDGKYWYLSMAHGMPYGKLYKFQTSDNKLVGETELGLFPATMQVSEATGFLYIVNFNLHGKML
ncbi:MAG: beta-propeller fold lactonase family protein, partial [Bacteroidota bacterium]